MTCINICMSHIEKPEALGAGGVCQYPFERGELRGHGLYGIVADRKDIEIGVCGEIFEGAGGDVNQLLHSAGQRYAQMSGHVSGADDGDTFHSAKLVKVVLTSKGERGAGCESKCLLRKLIQINSHMPHSAPQIQLHTGIDGPVGVGEHVYAKV